MPLIQYQLFVFLGKLLGLCQIIKSEAVGFPQFHAVRNVKDCLGARLHNMHVNRFMVVAVKAKAEAVLFKYFGHGSRPAYPAVTSYENRSLRRWVAAATKRVTNLLLSRQARFADCPVSNQRLFQLRLCHTFNQPANTAAIDKAVPE